MSTKVFVGNLAFATAADKLKEEFGVAGTVNDANIITRGPRSLGYGFVEMASPEEAEKAVQLLNHKEIDGRAVNVEVARPRQEPQAGGSDEDKPRQQRPRRNNKPRHTFRRRPQSGEEDGSQGSSGEQAEGSQEEGQAPKRRFRKRRINRPRTNRRRDTNDEQPEDQENQVARRPRTRRPPRPKQERVPSPTTLFVANLPFSTDDSGLAEIFSGITISSAHVVKKRNGRSKGFGFVEFATEEEQKSALEAVQNREVEGRVLSVKVALTAVPSVEADGEAAAQNGVDQAASSSSSSTEQVAESAAPTNEEASTTTPTTTTEASSSESTTEESK